jgi:hypothetical protein
MRSEKVKVEAKVKIKVRFKAFVHETILHKPEITVELKP